MFLGDNMKKADPFYKSQKWMKKRAAILKRDGYLCVLSKRYGKTIQADTVHHIYPRERYPEYAFSDWNLISLSTKMHNALHNRDDKTLTAEGEKLRAATIPPTPQQ